MFSLLSYQIKSIIFDKTGTLTVGKPSVVQTKIFSKMPLLELCDLAAGAEVGFLISRTPYHISAR